MFVFFSSLLYSPLIMPPSQRVPPVSEASFRREYRMMWDLAGFGCLVLGMGIAPAVIPARRPWFTLVLSIGVYLFSMLLCRVVLMAIWRRPHVTPPVLFFSIPVGALALAAVWVGNLFGGYFAIGRRSLFCFALTMGLLYVASLIWGIGIGIRRKKMGVFEVEEHG
jgi:hypothetical protein